VVLAGSCAFAEARVPKSFFGANAVNPTQSDFDSMKRSGVGTYRLLVFWQGVQSQAHGPYNWNQVDRLMYQAAVAGLRPMPVVQGVPPSLSPNPSRVIPPVRTRLMRKEWARFVEALVDRYRPGGAFWRDLPGLRDPGIRDWQIWNEQNAAGYWFPKAKPREYARLLKISDAAIARADPQARVVLGGMYGYPSSRKSMNAGEYLERLYRLPHAKRLFDTVAVHPFGDTINFVRRQLTVAHKVMKLHHDTRSKMFVSELGWGTPRPRDGNPLAVTREKQAKLVHRAGVLLLIKRHVWNLQGVTWFTWRDFTGSGGCIWCEHAGLRTARGRPKPALKTYRTLIRHNTRRSAAP
jgi:hypothetical protein